MKASREIYVSKRTVGSEFLSINTLNCSKDHKMGGLYYADIDIIYIKRISSQEDIFRTVIKTKSGNKMVFSFKNGVENIDFHKKIVDNYSYYLEENNIKKYRFHSILTRIDEIDLIESKTKIRTSRVPSENKNDYESWEYELIIVKTKFGNKASTEQFHYEDTFRKGLAIGLFADRDNYNN